MVKTLRVTVLRSSNCIKYTRNANHFPSENQAGISLKKITLDNILQQGNQEEEWPRSRALCKSHSYLQRDKANSIKSSINNASIEFPLVAIQIGCYKNKSPTPILLEESAIKRCRTRYRKN